MSLKFKPGTIYMMPVSFGPIWSQQQPWEGGKQMTDHFQPPVVNVVNLTFETDRDILENMIPECYTLRDPYVTAAFCEFTNCGWSHGRTYSLVNISCPVHFKGERDDVDGDYVMVMIENNADPIIFGREQLGYAKIFCDCPPIQHYENNYIARVSAYGFEFLKITLDLSKAPEDPEPVKANEAKSKGKMQFKYIPKTGELGEDPALNFTTPEIAYPTMNPKWVRPDDYPYEIMTPQVEWGSGTIEFRDPTWEDWPTFGNVGHGLAQLPVKRVLCARHVVYNDPAEYTAMYRLR